VNTTTGVTFVQAAKLLVAHLANYQLPEPAFLTVSTRARHSKVTAQLRSHTVPRIAAELLAWADTLPTVTVEAWRPPEGDRVQLSITSTLTSPTGTVDLDVYGGADHDPALLADLGAGDERSVSLGQLRAWAGAV
jgi:hypothetical protein